MLMKLKNKIIKYIFEKLYAKFDYPFENIDYLINRLSKERRQQYYQDIYNWINSEAYRMENTELKKLLYKELAMKTSSDLSRGGYRLALILKKKEEARFNLLVSKGQFEEKVDKIINT
jgi:hypothetical protein